MTSVSIELVMSINQNQQMSVDVFSPSISARISWNVAPPWTATLWAALRLQQVKSSALPSASTFFWIPSFRLFLSHGSQRLQSQQVFSLQQRWDAVQLVQRSRVTTLEWIIISSELCSVFVRLFKEGFAPSVSALPWSSVPTVLSCQDLTSQRRLYWTFLHGGLFWSPGRCIAVSSHSPEDRAQM